MKILHQQNMFSSMINYTTIYLLFFIIFYPFIIRNQKIFCRFDKYALFYDEKNKQTNQIECTQIRRKEWDRIEDDVKPLNIMIVIFRL